MHKKSLDISLYAGSFLCFLVSAILLKISVSKKYPMSSVSNSLDPDQAKCFVVLFCFG